MLSTIFVVVGNAAGILGIDMTLAFDESKISIVDVQAADRQSGYNVFWNVSKGSLQIAFYGIAPLKNGSRLVAITFRPNPQTKVVPPKIVSAFANEGAIPMQVLRAPLLPPKNPPVVVDETPQRESPKRK